MMNIYTFEKVQPKNSIFLAGPTYRIGSEFEKLRSWRLDAIELLDGLGFNGNILIPEYRNNIQPSNWNLSTQIEWETDALYKSSVILFWIPRNMKSLPGLTTNIEFGEWFKNNKIVAGSPSEAVKNDYLKYRYEKYGRRWHDSLENCITEVLKKLNRPENIFFTSDTHFNQIRTLELSKRPFKSVEDMDLTMISNWNSSITMNDVVYHLGDIGAVEPEILVKNLNFKHLYIVPGNYDVTEYLKKFNGMSNVTILDNNHIFEYEKDGIKYEIELVHEPSRRKTNNFLLYGHIHRLDMIKRNALNVGVDCHYFKPISIDEVLWHRNAILNHYDNEVFLQF